MDPVSLERRRLLPSSSLVNNARLIVNVLLLFAPFCGWLSDTKIGRGNAIYLGLWLGWIVLLLLPNILPYGIDQLMNESTVKIRAFIHWFWLCLYSGYQRFEHIPIPNPYKIVFKVLKFFLKTSRTRRQHRSAFTYWGEEPSRMDLAKESQCDFFHSVSDTFTWDIALIANVLYLLAPFCGCLSDTKIGRGNAIYLGLWLGWIGALIQAVGCCLQYNSFQCSTVSFIGRVVIPFVFMLVSLSLLLPNILPYGIDQLMNESTVKIRAFIH
uniref:Uncharacterized protein n=1 Tax=Amphimedon queenslandica TaxID=400682 RepID=A0A1X7TVV8_AMPQE